MGAAWETLAFILHSLGAKDQQNLGYSTSWTLLFLLAPLWINGFVYMTFARMVLYWHPENRVAGLRSNIIAGFFVFADIFSFLIQAVGGVMATSDLHGKMGLVAVYVYMAGMGVQQFFILIFLVLMILFQRRCSREPLYDADAEVPVIDNEAPTDAEAFNDTNTAANAETAAVVNKPSWRPLLYALYAVLVFITVSIPFPSPSTILPLPSQRTERDRDKDHLRMLLFLRLSNSSDTPVSRNTDPHHLPAGRVLERIRPQQSDPAARGVRVRARLLPHDAHLLDPGHLPPGPLPARTRQRVPPEIAEGEEGPQAGGEGGKEGSKGGEEGGGEGTQGGKEG